MGRKLGSSAPFWGRGAGSPSNRMSLGLGPASLPSGILIYPAVWPQQIWAENWGALPPFGGGGAGYLSDTMWPGPRPTCMPSFMLIIQPFGHNRYGPKIGGSGAPHPFGGGELGPHLTQCSQGQGLPACEVSSRSIQPFGHNIPTSQTDRTDRQQSDSVWRTIL